MRPFAPVPLVRSRVAVVPTSACNEGRMSLLLVVGGGGGGGGGCRGNQSEEPLSVSLFFLSRPRSHEPVTAKVISHLPSTSLFSLAPRDTYFAK